MTPEEYARVKEVFAAAIELPETDREGFVRMQCADTPNIAGEVFSLLGHHQDKTILDTPTVTSGQRRTLSVADVEPSDSYLINSEIWDENRHILRRRLIAIAYVMAVFIAFSLLRLFTDHYAALGYGARIFALAVSLGCAWLLQRYHNLTLAQIRIAEFVVMANTGLLAAVIYIRLMLDSAADGDEATLISVNNWNYFVWTLIIFVYGVFMPNTWRRAMAVLLPVAALPTLVSVIAASIDPQVAVLLKDDKFGRPIPTPFVAAGIAIYAAQLIHGARLSAFQARHLGQYHLRRMIGEGGMGQVFEAEHLLLKRSCAIKVIRPEHCVDDQALRKFEREVRSTAQLTHPNTIEVYDYGQTTDGVFFFAMELLPGMNLGSLVQTVGPLPAPRVVHFLTEICGALQEAHLAGLIHRDIKPANVFASQRGGIWDFTKLLDFGLVREMSVDPSQSISAGMIAGTPGFMAPEQISSPLQVDVKTDIYSVGAVGYFLLTGRPPFIADSPLEVMIAQTKQPAAAPSSLRSDIPSDLESVLMKCLSADASRRIPTAEDLKAELQSCDCFGQWTERDAADWWDNQGETQAGHRETA